MPTNPLVNSFSDTFASPIVDVIIYPYYTGNPSPGIGSNGISFSSLNTSPTAGGLKAVEVRKSVLDANMSTFGIELAPGGPKGVDDIQTWTSILTPMSLVLIGMRRGTLKRIVMVGVITSIEETQNWTQDRVERTISIQGMDFTYFFSNFSMFQFTALGVIASSLPGGLVGSTLSNLGLTGAESPIVIGLALYQFMWGKIPSPVPLPTIFTTLGTGIMSQTRINNNGNLIPVSNALTIKFEQLLIELSGNPTTVTPALWAFSFGDGNWLGQFRDVFSDPWYEFYVMTAQTSDVFTRYDSLFGGQGTIPSPISGVPNQVTTSATGATSTPFSIPNYPDTNVYVVARVAPPPFVDQLGNLHNSDWVCLPIYQDNSFIRSTVTFDVAGHGNMMFLLPDFMIASFDGGGANNNATAAEISGMAVDIYGISKYGFKPINAATKWFAGNFVNLGSNNSTRDTFKAQLQFLQMKLAGLFVPAPQQLTGEVVLPLRPDILPGNRFQYKPFKNDGYWLFYNPSVTHRWEFGKEATTTLQLSKGLPLNLYNNQNPQTGLAQLILGNMEIQYNTNANTLIDPSTRYVVRNNVPTLKGTAFVIPGGDVQTIPVPNSPGVY